MSFPAIKPLSAKVVLMALALGILGGCNSTLKKPEVKPAALVNLSSNQFSLREVFADGLSSDDDRDPLRLKPARISGGYLAAGRGGEIARYDLAGNQLWSQSIKNPIVSGVAANENLLVIGDRKGRILAYDLAGKLIWKTQLDSPTLAPALLLDQVAIVQLNNGTVTALDLNSGEVRWNFSINIPPFSLRGMASPVELSPNIVAVAAADGRVHAIRVDLGVPIWARKVAISSGTNDFNRLVDTDADPIFYNFNLYTASFQSQLLGIDLRTRQQIFEQALSSTKTPALDNEHIFVVDELGVIHAYDLQNGNKVWTQRSLIARGLSNPVVLNNQLIVGDQEGYLHSLNPQTGQVNGRERTKGAVLTLTRSGLDLLVQTKKDVISVWRPQAR